MNEEIVEKVLVFLDLGSNKHQKTGLLRQIVAIVSARLCLKIGRDTVPKDLEYIIIEVTISRYNLVGNEGMDSYSQDGESIQYADLFSEYEKDITQWCQAHNKAKKGFRFL